MGQSEFKLCIRFVVEKEDEYRQTIRHEMIDIVKWKKLQK